MKLGIISDTHGYFDPRIPTLFSGVEHILHAGDVGSMAVVQELERLAPVTAVLGNVDQGLPLQERAVIDLAGLKFFLHHIVDPYAPAERWEPYARKTKADVIVFGHTHQPRSVQVGNVLFFNPGYAGRQRFTLPRSVALMHFEDREIRHEFLPL